MRIIANNVEFYIPMRDQYATEFYPNHGNTPSSPVPSLALNGFQYDHSLRDSLWIFQGDDLKLWTDVFDVLRPASEGFSIDRPPPISVPLDFYPLSVLLPKGLILGVEPEAIQRRDTSFTYHRFIIRTHLFIPHVLRLYLAQYDSSAALHLSQYYSHLSYFPHALEVLLHNVLDEEVDHPPTNPDSALLPTVLSFLSGFPQYLDILVQCTRKTELRSWRTLFLHLPTPQELFEQSLEQGNLKTAGGYLLVLHAFDEPDTGSQHVVRLLRRAKDARDWELCKELARFLIALDGTGDALRKALELVGLRKPNGELLRNENGGGISPVMARSGSFAVGLGLEVPGASRRGSKSSDMSVKSRSSGGYADSADGSLKEEGEDYFGLGT